MRTAKIALTVYFIGSLFCASVVAADPLSQALDLNSLLQFSYFGQDQLRRRSACHLEIEPAQRDFAGRPFQNLRVWVDPNQYSASLKYKGAARQIPADSRTASGQLKFKLASDGLELEVLTDSNDTNNITEFRLFDRNGVSGNPGLFVECTGVRSVRH